MTVRSKALYQHIQYIVDSAGRPTHVILPIEVFERLDSLLEIEEANRWISELVGATRLSDDEPFGFGMTVGEYFSLPEQERERLWDDAFAKELDKSEAVEVGVKPDAIAPKQRSYPKVRRRGRQRRKGD